MELTKLNPWNWFKKEEEQTSSNVPVHHSGAGQHSLQQLHKEIDRLFDNAFSSFGFPSLGLDSALFPTAQNVFLKPHLDIASDKSQYTITVEVPGVEEENINLELVDRTLTIKGEKKLESESKEKDFYRVERSYGSFQRVLSLPDDAQADQIDAKFKNGVLTISMPRKKAQKPESKIIHINKAA